MKLRNKKTREEIDTQEMFYPDDIGELFGKYKTLAELNEEWEDVPDEKSIIDAQAKLLREKDKRIRELENKIKDLENYNHIWDE